jgi:uncharacterized membrane protein YqaE (UPF0057 family)
VQVRPLTLQASVWAPAMRVAGVCNIDMQGFPKGMVRRMGKVLLIILCLFLPFLAVLIRKGPCIEVLWAFLLQLLGHIPGVIYGLYEVTSG